MNMKQAIQKLAVRDIFEAKESDLFIGRPFYLDFDKAYLLITDAWKERVGGIPQGSFILAFYENENDDVEECLLVDLKIKPFIDPDDFSKLQNIQRIKLVIPTKGIALEGEEDLKSSVRKSIFNFFCAQPENNGFMNALKWLIFEEYNNSSQNVSWHLATCPSCNEGVDIQVKDLSSKYTITCPRCKGEIYLTDVFRLHEAIDNELGAGGILGYLTTAVEQIIVVYLIKQMLSIKPKLLSETLFVKDGPLAFFGQTAKIHGPMRKLITYLNCKHNIYFIGLEKSGSFVEHAEQVSKDR